MNMLEIGRERGRKAALQAKQSGRFAEHMREDIAWNARLFPTRGKNFDFVKANLDYDRKRLACTPDLTRFPELRGLADRHVGEREGLVEGGFTPEEAAYHYTFGFYIWKHINAHHVARYDLNEPPAMNCTNVFIPESAEDGVLTADNRDDVIRPSYYKTIPAHRIGRIKRDNTVSRHQGGVSAAVMLDEEPACIFPCNPWDVMPDACYDDIKDMVAFMDRYRDFWGPGNQMWCDRQLRGVMVEKANVRVAFRYPKVRGAMSITACSYIDPELNAYKRACLKRVMAAKGENDQTSPDWQFAEGCDARQRRLLALTEAAAAKGATLWDAVNIVSDHDVPFPERVCLAGEKGMPDKEPLANWSLTQHAIVQTGPNRRAMYRSLQDLANPRPVYEHTPKLVLGEGVAMKPQWQADVDAGRVELVEA